MGNPIDFFEKFFWSVKYTIYTLKTDQEYYYYDAVVDMSEMVLRINICKQDPAVVKIFLVKESSKKNSLPVITEKKMRFIGPDDRAYFKAVYNDKCYFWPK